MLELINHVPTHKQLQFYCFTNKQIGITASKIHGITNDFLTKHKSFEDQHESFLNFIGKDTLIIHNAEFDLGFINNELNLIGVKPLTNKIIDTVKLARNVLNTRTANLDYLCRRFDIDLSERNLHGALKDTLLLADVYLELVGGKQISMELGRKKEEEKINSNEKVNKNFNISKVEISKKEILLHKSLVGGIKNSLWEKINY